MASHGVGLSVVVCLAASLGVYPAPAQHIAAGVASEQARQQQRYEQQRAFADYNRTEVSQARFLSLQGFSPSLAWGRRQSSAPLSPSMRESFVSTTSRSAPKLARKAYVAASREMRNRKPQLDRAAELLEQAVVSHPQYAAAWTLLGTVRQRQGDPAGARNAFARSIEADPKYLESYIAHANLAIAEQNWKEVVSVADEIIKVNPAFTLGYYYRGAGLLRLGHAEEAHKAAITARSTVNTNLFPETHFLLGEVYAEQGHYPLAAREYRIYLKQGASGIWGEYVKNRIKEWRKLGVLDRGRIKKRRG